jgi:hypothetical protein
MKKLPKKKNLDDNFNKITRRNWIIFGVALVLFLVFQFVLPVIIEMVR